MRRVHKASADAAKANGLTWGASKGAPLRLELIQWHIKRKRKLKTCVLSALSIWSGIEPIAQDVTPSTSYALNTTMLGSASRNARRANWKGNRMLPFFVISILVAALTASVIHIERPITPEEL